MQIVMKPINSSKLPAKPPKVSISAKQRELALKAAQKPADAQAQAVATDFWARATLTSGGGVQATVAALKRTRGPNKRPTKTQVAIRLDADVLEALRATGPRWQTRANSVLKAWLAQQAVTA
jgi:uncharacterized protein (DUF4415 family)